MPGSGVFSNMVLHITAIARSPALGQLYRKLLIFSREYTMQLTRVHFGGAHDYGGARCLDRWDSNRDVPADLQDGPSDISETHEHCVRSKLGLCLTARTQFLNLCLHDCP